MFRVCEQFAQDLRYAVRVMAANPLFTAMAGLSLALGIGANTAIYSFMDAILLRALPVKDPESLVVLNWHSRAHPPVARNMNGSTYQDARTGYTSGNFPYPVFELFRDNSPVFSSIFAFNNAGRLNMQINGQADLANGQYVSGGFFSGLGIPQVAGRSIDANDDRFGAPPVAVISFGYAQRFGEASKAVDQSIRINDNLFTIVGVAAPEFFGVSPPGPQDVYLPMHTSVLLDTVYFEEQRRKYQERNFYWVEMMGRLRPGVTRQAGPGGALSGFPPVHRKHRRQR